MIESAARPSDVRWRILAIMVLVSLVSYLLRGNLSIADPAMVEDLQLTEIQWGWIMAAFPLGYASFQFSGGCWGDRKQRASKLRLQATAPDAATKPNDLAAPGWRLHALTGEFRGFHSITVNGNWRVIFRFVGQDVELVDYSGYH